MDGGCQGNHRYSIKDRIEKMPTNGRVISLAILHFT